jgi:glycerol transport system substrate-binding protein
MNTKISRRLLAVATGFLATAALATAPARANEAAAKKWIDKEFQPSTLN